MIRFVLALALLLLAPLSAEAANRFAVCSTSCTWDGASTAMWSTTTGGGTGASVPGTGDAVILDAATCVGGTTCTITVNTTVTVQSITMGDCTASTAGCILDFSVNNNNVTLSQLFNGGGTGTRTLKMGSGTWTLSSNNGSVWLATPSTNFTLNAGTSTILASADPVSNRNFYLGTSLTYSTISIANTAAKSFDFYFNATTGSTIGTLTIATPINVQFEPFATYTITNAVTWAGTASNSVLGIRGGQGTAPTLALAGGSTITWAAIQGITFTGSPTVTNSFDLKGNSGATISGPAGGGGGRIIGG